MFLLQTWSWTTGRCAHRLETRWERRCERHCWSGIITRTKRSWRIACRLSAPSQTWVAGPQSSTWTSLVRRQTPLTASFIGIDPKVTFRIFWQVSNDIWGDLMHLISDFCHIWWCDSGKGQSREIIHLPFLDLTWKEELSVSLSLISFKVKLKSEMKHLWPALVSVEGLKCKDPKRTLIYRCKEKETSLTSPFLVKGWATQSCEGCDPARFSFLPIVGYFYHPRWFSTC